MPLPIVEKETADKIIKRFKKFENLEKKVTNFEKKHLHVATILQIVGCGITEIYRENLTADLFEEYKYHEIIQYNPEFPKILGMIGGTLVYDLLETQALKNQTVLPIVSEETTTSYRKSLKETITSKIDIHTFYSEMLQQINKVNPQITIALNTQVTNQLLHLPIKISGAIAYTLLERQAESDELEKMI